MWAIGDDDDSVYDQFFFFEKFAFLANCPTWHVVRGTVPIIGVYVILNTNVTRNCFSIENRYFPILFLIPSYYTYAYSDY